MNIQNTLDEREKRYGRFSHHAKIAQSLKDVLIRADKWNTLKPYQKEALEMIAHKIGRILNGDASYIDSWHDIAGFATLVEQELQRENRLETST